MDSEACPIPATRLRIAGGLHDGARCELSEDGTTLVGAAPDCDLCLADEHVAPRHVLIVSQGGRRWLRALDGALEVDGRAVAPGETCRIATTLSAAIVPSSVALQFECRSPATPSKAVVEPPRWRPAGVMFLGLAALVMAAVALSAVGASPFSRAQISTALPDSLQIHIERLGLSDHITIEYERDRPVLRGLLSHSQLSELRAAVAPVAPTVVWDVTTTAELLQQVRDIFRTNGYRANLTYAGEGTVQVTNLDASHASVARAADHVRRDVGRLRALRFASPESAQPPDDAPTLGSVLPGTRPAAVVDGRVAFVSTGDGGRYFVGSVLPDGARIRSITLLGVQVERNGEIAWLRHASSR